MSSELVFWRPRRGRPCAKSGRDRAMQAVYIASLLNSTDPPDLEELRAIARDVGFLSPEIRRQAWPLLLGVKLKVEEASKNASSQALSTTHKDNKQVQLDVIRSMCNLGLRRREREQRLNDLSTVIDSILAANPDLHYYQGFNDVCSIAILVMGSVEQARPVAERLAKFHFREAMNTTLLAVQQALKIILRIVERRDKKLYLALEETGVEPIYAISWILTWFAHDLRSLPQIERVYDFFIATHPLMSLYLSASVLSFFREGIIAARGDYAIVHGLLQTLPSDLPLDRLIADAYRTFKLAPPHTVIAAASLERERAFTPGSPWRDFPQFSTENAEGFCARGSAGSYPRLIAWKKNSDRSSTWRRAVVSGQVGIISSAILGGCILVHMAPNMLRIENVIHAPR
mmetsp:Transcript_29273/g.69535  ORF Transcript_29273/g.69535 Transcript_29273/m.69535 type:complete len:401 (-) Transcript_29273:1078-2280(-)